MTLYEFRLLSEEEQAQTIWFGQFFLSREDREYTVLLYKVYDFYVEAYYSNESERVVKLNPFSSKERLKLYFSLQLN
ncbi:MAG TPA: hypothetical protein VGN63_23025 [Flavisolibacter sp.]|jgi:hypothetical protein|nr:hypothetical protein [Flavisolibacter sp.]